MAKGRKTGGRDFSKEYQPKVRGRKPMPADLRQANQLTKAHLQGLLNKYLWFNQAELQAALVGSETPMIERVIAAIIHKALMEGDERRLTFILDRMIGKVKEEIDIKTFSDNLEVKTESEIIELGAEALKFLKVVPND